MTSTRNAEGGVLMPQSYMAWRWWTIALRGLAAIVLGILSLNSPKITLVTLVVVFGAYAIVDGVLALAIGRSRAGQSRGTIIARGLVSLVAGAVALMWPGMTTLALLVVFGAWSIAAGVLEIAAAIRLHKHIEHEWLLGIEGALSIAFGAALLISPLTGAVVLGLWIGAYALVLGGLMIGTAFRMRTFQQEHPELAVPAAA